MLRGIVAVLLVLLPLACAKLTSPDDAEQALGPESGVPELLSVDRAEYVPGDTALLRLHNVIGKPLGYNLCSSAWEIREGSAWRRIEPLRLCTRELRLLAVGEAATWSEPITAEWAAGEYRFVTRVYLEEGGSSEVFTRPFRVRR